MLGYHGTSKEIAGRIASGEALKPSEGDFHWLGEGVYFFAEALEQRKSAAERALDFARRKHGDEAAVVYAEIEEDGMLDLVENAEHLQYVRNVYDEISHALLPDQLPGQGRHPLDCYVVEEACRRLDKAEWHVRSVRALFDEYPTLYPGTAIVRDPHIQIAVRDLGAIDQPVVW